MCTPGSSAPRRVARRSRDKQNPSTNAAPTKRRRSSSRRETSLETAKAIGPWPLRAPSRPPRTPTQLRPHTTSRPTWDSGISLVRRRRSVCQTGNGRERSILAAAFARQLFGQRNCLAFVVVVLALLVFAIGWLSGYTAARRYGTPTGHAVADTKFRANGRQGRSASGPPLLCRFLAAEITRGASDSGGRRPKSAKARSRGKLGSGWASSVMGIRC